MPTLYWKNVDEDQAWENPNNWFTDAAATIPAANAPWIDGVDASYLAYDLTRADGELASVIIDGSQLGSFSIGGGISGIVDFDALENYGTINEGTFSGDGLINHGTINEGTFSGDGLILNGNITGGIFSGEGVTNSSGFITGGTFSGTGFVNQSTIRGGVFSGDGFANSGSISGGTFSEGAALSLFREGVAFEYVGEDSQTYYIYLENQSASVLDVLGAGLL